ncbi:hypothetical protein STRAU_4751 [Streptomyces aurantiacus JA 4570]|uniref:Uncharacterized protein n=1 Tax=Streptomyces aurantiacus JA 4570 TaxID=1286094 RepID=S3ZEV4_9ACTN|nr:hypothetical protein STRAU_4751 [Streptomyces aurantiacus JA 4570]
MPRSAREADGVRQRFCHRFLGPPCRRPRWSPRPSPPA